MALRRERSDFLDVRLRAVPVLENYAVILVLARERVPVHVDLLLFVAVVTFLASLRRHAKTICTTCANGIQHELRPKHDGQPLQITATLHK